MSLASARKVEINLISPLPHEREKEPGAEKRNSVKSRLKKCFTFDFQLVAAQQLNQMVLLNKSELWKKQLTINQ